MGFFGVGFTSTSSYLKDGDTGAAAFATGVKLGQSEAKQKRNRNDGSFIKRLNRNNLMKLKLRVCKLHHRVSVIIRAALFVRKLNRNLNSHIHGLTRTHGRDKYPLRNRRCRRPAKFVAGRGYNFWDTCPSCFIDDNFNHR